MEKIHKIIVGVLACGLAVIMIAGIIVSSTKKDGSREISYDLNDSVTDDSSEGEMSTTTTSPRTTTTASSENEAEASSSSQTDSNNEAALKLMVKDISVKIGDTKQLEIKCEENAEAVPLTFSSGNKNVATVDKNGKVKGVEVGTCKLTVKGENVEKVTVTVTVTDEYGTKPVSERTIYATGCNFRVGPGLDYNVISYLNANTELTVIGECEDWYRVRYKDYVGFVGMTVVQDEPLNLGGNSGSSAVNTTRPTVTTTAPSTTTKAPSTTTKTPSTTTEAPSTTTVPPTSAEKPTTTTVAPVPEEPDNTTSTGQPDFIIGGI